MFLLDLDAVEEIWSDYSTIPWPKLLSGAKEVHIAVDYLYSWIDQQKDLLVTLLVAGTNIHVYFPDPSKPYIADLLCQRYPDKLYNQNEAKARVLAHAVPRLHQVQSEAEVAMKATRSTFAAGKITVRLLDHALNFAMHVIDEKKVLLGVYEHHRERRIGSPVLLLNFQKSEALQKYFQKELKYLQDHSTIVPTTQVQPKL